MLNDKKIDFNNKEILLLALPILLEQLLGYAVGLVDSLMAAKLGAVAMSSVTIVNHMAMVLSNIFMAFSVGGTMVISFMKGSGRSRLTGITAGMVMLLVILLAAMVVAVTASYPETLIGLLFAGVAEEIKQDTIVYWQLIVYSFLPLALYHAGAAVARGYGNTRLPLMVMGAANIINILGNYIFAYQLKLGVFGIGIASLIARGVAGVFILALLLKTKERMPLSLKGSLRLKRSLLERIIKVAVPYGFETGLMQVGRVLLISIVSILGTQVLACNVVAGTLSMLQLLPGMALCYTIAIILPRCYGAGRSNLAKFYLRKIIKLIMVTEVIAAIGVILILPMALKQYSLQETGADLVKRIIYLHSFFGVLIWPFTNALPMYFRAAGTTVFPSVVSTASLFICRLGLSYLFIVVLDLDYVFVWLAMFSDWSLRAMCFILKERSLCLKEFCFA